MSARDSRAFGFVDVVLRLWQIHCHLRKESLLRFISLVAELFRARHQHGG